MQLRCWSLLNRDQAKLTTHFWRSKTTPTSATIRRPTYKQEHARKWSNQICMLFRCPLVPVMSRLPSFREQPAKAIRAQSLLLKSLLRGFFKINELSVFRHKTQAFSTRLLPCIVSATEEAQWEAAKRFWSFAWWKLFLLSRNSLYFLSFTKRNNKPKELSYFSKLWKLETLQNTHIHLVVKSVTCVNVLPWWSSR